jgi:hydrogenase/urease accessory protein HupE
MNQTESPVQEAVSLISIAAILLAIGCYAGASRNLPIISPSLFWVAAQIYGWFPALSGLHAPQLPMVISAAVVGGLFYLIALPFAGLLASAFNASQIAAIERQTIKLRRNRARIQKSRRDRDSFESF